MEAGQRELAQLPSPSWFKLFFLGVLALVLCSFLPLSIFAPVPLAIAGLVYGRSKMLAMVVVLSLSLLALAAQVGQMTSVIFGLFVLAFCYSAVLVEIILRKVHPIKGLLRGGLGLFLFALTVVGLVSFLIATTEKTGPVFQMEQVIQTSVEQFKLQNAEFLAKGGSEARMVEDLISRPPKQIVKDFLGWLPSGLFVSSFFGLWLGLFILLRNRPFLELHLKYPYTLNDLVRFQVPYFFVYLLIVGLVFALAGEMIHPELGPIIGMNLLYSLGLFYLFQGLGVFLDFLAHLKITGPMRSLMMVLGLFMAWKALALVGVFDVWVNFRRFLKNDKKGDSK